MTGNDYFKKIWMEANEPRQIQLVCGSETLKLLNKVFEDYFDKNNPKWKNKKKN